MDTNRLNQYGYYVVADEKIYNKLEAFRKAIDIGHLPHWHFHEDVFSSVNWLDEPQESLKTLYKKRAAQLRNKYNKLILSFSGGTDSSTVADTFVYNGIKLDYLLNRDISHRMDRRDLKNDEGNMHNEPVFVARPQYEKYKEVQPDLEMVSWDYIDRVMDFWENTPETDPYTWNCYVPNTIIKDNILELFPHLENTSRCVIHAIDKPIIFYINGRFYITFQDDFVSQHVPSAKNFAVNETVTEFFFWSTDATDLLRKQAHAMKNFFKKNTHLLPLISQFPHRKIDNYREIVATAVYDPIKTKIWQPQKPNSRWMLASEKWFYEGDSKAMQNWKKFFFSYEEEANKLIQDKSLLYVENKDKFSIYGEKVFNGLPGCYGKLYDIGV